MWDRIFVSVGFCSVVVVDLGVRLIWIEGWVFVINGGFGGCVGKGWMYKKDASKPMLVWACLEGGEFWAGRR